MNTSFKKTASVALVAAALVLGAGCSRDKSAGQTVDDAAIEAKVKMAFAQDPGVKAIEVKVDTYKGTVQLHGWVNTKEEKDRAEQIAKTIPGVKAVENRVSVKTDKR